MSEWNHIRSALAEMASSNSSSNYTAIHNPFSDGVAVASSCTSAETATASDSSENTVIITSRSSKDTVVVDRIWVEISEFTIPFKHVDSLDLPKTKFEKIQHKAWKLCKRTLSAKQPQHRYVPRPKLGLDSSKLNEVQERILSETVRITRRLGQEVIYYVDLKSAARHGFLWQIECERAERLEKLEKDLARRREKFEMKRVARQQEKKYVRFAKA